MADYYTHSFEPEELDLMAQVVEQVIRVKIKRLRSAKSIDGFRTYMLKFIDQFDRNEFKMNSADENTCAWLRDQIEWSGLDRSGEYGQQAQRLIRILDEACELRRVHDNRHQGIDRVFKR